MNFARISKSLAVAGVSTAMAAGALVGATTTSANAATATGDYTCSVPTLGDYTFPTTVDVAALDALTSAPAGMTVPEGLLDAVAGPPAVHMTFEVPAALATTLTTLGGVSAVKSSDFAMVMGSQKVPVAQMALASVDDGTAGSKLIKATGTNGAFVTPKAGSYDITMPSTFNVTPTVGALGDVPIACTTASPKVLSHIVLAKQASTIAVGKVKTVRTTQHAKVPVTVKNDYSTPTGKVVAKEGSKILGSSTLKAGKAVISLARLKPGLHKIFVTYKGDGYTKGIKSKVVAVKIIK